METDKNQEIIIVNAISQMVIPSDVFEKSEFKQIINDFKSAQEGVNESLNSIDEKRKAVKEGNFLGNLWHNRKEDLQDAQLDLNKSIGLLTERSSNLVLFNTAISKVLVSQQKVLHEQQELLQKQANELASQNKCIERQQVNLSEQQQKLLEVNQGLLEAKGITREHAEKLVGCVRRVEAAEQKMDASNQELERSVVSRVVACENRAESIKGEVDEALYSYRQEAAIRFDELDTECKSTIEALRGHFSNFDLKIHAESEARRLVATSLTEEFNQRIGVLRNEQAVSSKKLLAELESAKEMFASTFSVLSSSFDKREIDVAEKHKKLLYFSVSALIVSVLSLSTSAYIFSGV